MQASFKAKREHLLADWKLCEEWCQQESKHYPFGYFALPDF